MAKKTLAQQESFREKVYTERQRHAAKGFNLEHDQKEGLVHLLVEALENLSKDEIIKGSSLIVAALDLYSTTNPSK